MQKATSLDCVSQICRSVQAATLPCDRIQKRKVPEILAHPGKNINETFPAHSQDSILMPSRLSFPRVLYSSRQNERPSISSSGPSRGAVRGCASAAKAQLAHVLTRVPSVKGFDGQYSPQKSAAPLKAVAPSNRFVHKVLNSFHHRFFSFQCKPSYLHKAG